MEGNSITIGEEFIPGAGPVETIVMDTGERVDLSAIDTNANGDYLHASSLREVQDELKAVERQAPKISPLWAK